MGFALLCSVWKGQAGAGLATQKRESVDTQSSPSHPPHRVQIIMESTSLGLDIGKGPFGQVCAAQGSYRSEQSGAE